MLSKYIADIGKVNSTHELNDMLFANWKSGDRKSYDQLVRNYLPLAIKIASTYQITGMLLEDIISNANIGIIKGLDSFNPEAGALSTWLKIHIKAEINRECVNKSTVVRLPENHRAYSDNGRHEKYKQVSTDTVINENGSTLADFLKEDEIDIFNEVDPRIAELLSKLIDRDKKIVTLFFGLDGVDRDSDDVAEIMNMTRARVNQIIANIKKGVYSKKNFKRCV